MEEQKKLDLEPVYDTGTGAFVIKDYETNKKIVEDFVERTRKAVIEIHDEASYNEVRKLRTDVRAKVDMVAEARKHNSALIIGTFNEQAKYIEKTLKGLDDELKAKVDAYKQEEGIGVIKPKVISLTVKGLDFKVLQEVETFAKSKGLSVSWGKK